MHNTFNRLSLEKRYRHFESIEGEFYNQAYKYEISSTNGFAIDTNSLNEEYRISRFIRDPRDLIISGYFYHLKGSEPWFKFKNPTPKYWSAINGKIPDSMPSNLSFSEYLQKLSKEEGILAEMEFRKYHLESMMEWNDNNNIKLFKYEDILNNETRAISDLFDFYEIGGIRKKIGVSLAKKFSAKNQKGNSHIRNPSSGQWKEHFTDKIKNIFADKYENIISRYSYDSTR